VSYTLGQHRLVGAPMDAARIDAWRRTLSSRDIRIIEGELGDSLELLGYQRESTSVSVTTARTVGELLQTLTTASRKKIRHHKRTRPIMNTPRPLDDSSC
jgi:hypothetical protein